MASSDDSFEKTSGDGAHRRRRRHPSYELQRSCDRDTNASNMTGDNTLGGSMSDDKDDGDYALARDLAERLVKRTELRVNQVVSSSSYVQKHCTLYQIPRLERDDFVLGDMIAFGGFSRVFPINKFLVESELTDESKNGKQSFVIKNLNPKLALNPKKLVVGAKDLVMEVCMIVIVIVIIVIVVIIIIIIIIILFILISISIIMVIINIFLLTHQFTHKNRHISCRPLIIKI